jgi:tetratricopeptide (TPR) repeat protein
MNNLVNTLNKEGHWVEAEKLGRETLQARRRVLGAEHPDTGDAVYTLAVIEEHEGRRDEALKLLRQAIEHGLPPEEGLDMESDPDLKSLQGDPRFTALVVETKKRAAAIRKGQ